MGIVCAYVRALRGLRALRACVRVCVCVIGQGTLAGRLQAGTGKLDDRQIIMAMSDDDDNNDDDDGTMSMRVASHPENGQAA